MPWCPFLLRRSLTIALVPLLATPLIGGEALAQAPSEGSEVILTVTGNVRGDGRRNFTLASLDALGIEALDTATPWTSGMQHFTGARLSSVLTAAGAQGRTLKLVALNSYAITIPASDAAEHGVLLATRLEGKPMQSRDKGPIWLVYPWSQQQRLNNISYFERSIWQLRRIEIL